MKRKKMERMSSLIRKWEIQKTILLETQAGCPWNFSTAFPPDTILKVTANSATGH